MFSRSLLLTLLISLAQATQASAVIRSMHRTAPTMAARSMITFPAIAPSYASITPVAMAARPAMAQADATSEATSKYGLIFIQKTYDNRPWLLLSLPFVTFNFIHTVGIGSPNFYATIGMGLGLTPVVYNITRKYIKEKMLEKRMLCPSISRTDAFLASCDKITYISDYSKIPFLPIFDRAPLYSGVIVPIDQLDAACKLLRESEYNEYLYDWHTTKTPLPSDYELPEKT